MNVKTKAFDYTEALKAESKNYRIWNIVLFFMGMGLFLAFFMMVSILFRLPFTFSEYGIFSRSIAVFYHHNDNKYYDWHYYYENTKFYL